MLRHEIVSHIEELPVYFNYYDENSKLVPSHWHHHLEVLYILKGSKEIVLNQSSYTLREKDMFVINSEFIHLTRIKESATTLLLQVPYSLIEQSIPKINQLHFHDYFQHACLNDDDCYEEMTSSLLEMHRIFQAKEKGYSFLFCSYLHKFLHNLYVHYSAENTLTILPYPEKHRIHLRKAIDYITAHYREPISLSEIATVLSINPEYFCRMFKKNMGSTFLEYLNQIRLTYIYDDLIKSHDTITQIRERHGFTNYKVFNRMFKDTYGCTPSFARKNI